MIVCHLNVLVDFIHDFLIQKYFPYSMSKRARLESAYSLNWGAHEIWGQGGGETLALL